MISRRLATKEDVEFARQVHHLAMRDVVEKQFGPWVEENQDKWFYDAWLPKPNEIILYDGIPCGYCSVEDKGDHIFINEILILPEFQGQGIGTKIISEVIKEGGKKNIPVRLQVLKQNKAQDLYRRIGFKDIGQTETHYQMEILP